MYSKDEDINLNKCTFYFNFYANLNALNIFNNILSLNSKSNLELID